MSFVPPIINQPAAGSNRPQSPLRVCLKYLEEGHDPLAALEFVAEWGTSDIKRQFQIYLKQVREGKPISVLLEEITRAYPDADTELLVAAIEARLETGLFPPIAPTVFSQSDRQQTRLREDMELVIGPGRRWTLGLVWAGILGGAMLMIALPQYSALLESRIGQVVLGTGIGLEIVGLLWAGSLLRMQSRIERELEQV